MATKAWKITQNELCLLTIFFAKSFYPDHTLQNFATDLFELFDTLIVIQKECFKKS